MIVSPLLFYYAHVKMFAEDLSGLSVRTRHGIGCAFAVERNVDKTPHLGHGRSRICSAGFHVAFP